MASMKETKKGFWVFRMGWIFVRGSWNFVFDKVSWILRFGKPKLKEDASRAFEDSLK